VYNIFYLRTKCNATVRRYSLENALLTVRFRYHDHIGCLTKSSNTRAFSKLYLRVLFITTIRLCWRRITVAIESDYVMYLSALNMRSDWFFLLLRAYHFLTNNSLQSADKD